MPPKPVGSFTPPVTRNLGKPNAAQTPGPAKNGAPKIPATSDAFSTSTNGLLEAMENRLKVFIKDNFNQVKSEIKEMRASQQFLSDRYDEIMAKMQGYELCEKKVDSNAAKIEKLNADIQEMEKQLVAFKMQTTDLQQRSRIQNIEINGFPETQNENLALVLTDIAKHIGVNFHLSSVNVAHRTNTQQEGRPRPIIVNFFGRGAKREWVAKARAKRSINSTEINKNLPRSKVFIGEQMCPEYKILMGKAKAAASALGEREFQYVWFSDGRLLAKKNENCKAFSILTEKDIVNNIGPIPPQQQPTRM